MEAKNVSVELSVEELNKVIHGLVQMPYAQVYDVIEKIKKQAGEQLNPSGPTVVHS